MVTPFIPAQADTGMNENGNLIAQAPGAEKPSNVVRMNPVKKPGAPKVTVSIGDTPEEVDLGQFSFYEGNALLVDFVDNPYENLKWLADQENLAFNMGDGSKMFMGSELMRLMHEDNSTRTKWLAAADLGMKLCDEIDAEVVGEDGEVVEGAPRFPMLVQAVVEFAGKAQETLLSDSVLAKCEVEGSKDAEAIRLGEDASIALSSTIRKDNWEDDTDRMMHVLGASGTTFRKWYFDDVQGKYVSVFLTGHQVIVNNNISSLAEAPRISEPFTLYPHEVKRYLASKHFAPFMVEQEDFRTDPHKAVEFTEVHLWMDLDGDGQDEPYIVTIHTLSQHVVRLVTAYNATGFSVTEKGLQFRKVAYYQDYHLVRSFDGTFYSYGFGKLIGKLNENANKMIQSITDSAERHNANTGVIAGQALSLPDDLTLKPDTLNVIETTGGVLRDSLVMLPTKEPPATLFSVLGLLMEKSDRLAATTDLLQNASGNMPATTAMAIVNQGMAAHSAIHKRLWRSMSGEFNTVFQLLKENQKGKNPYRAGKKSAVLDLASLPADVEIFVTADPALTSEMHRSMQANYYMGFMEDPFTNQEELRMRVHSLMKVPEPEKLIQPAPEGPSPEELKERAEMDLKMLEQKRKATETSMKAKLTAAQISKLLADAVSTITPEDSKGDLGSILSEATRLIQSITGAEIAQSDEQQASLNAGGGGEPTPPPGNGPVEGMPPAGLGAPVEDVPIGAGDPVSGGAGEPVDGFNPFA